MPKQCCGAPMSKQKGDFCQYLEQVYEYFCFRCGDKQVEYLRKF